MIYEIAGRRVCIQSVYEEVHELCRDYRIVLSGLEEGLKKHPITTDSMEEAIKADILVQTTQKDIDYERERSAREDEKEGVPIRHFSDSYLETLAVYRQLAEQLLDYSTLLFHGSVIAVDGVGYLFTAKSGTGKSTHTRLWREYFGERAIMVNDDKPLLQINEGGVTVYGTPWDGKHRLSSNIAVPLKAICILNRGEQNHIQSITRKEAYSMLLQQTHRPTSPIGLTKTMQLLDKLTECVKLYNLHCNMQTEAAQVAYEGML